MQFLSLWTGYGFLAFKGLLYLGPVLLAGAALFQCTLSFRRRPELRRTAYQLLAVCAALLVAALPYVADELTRYWWLRLVEDDHARTLATQQEIGGVQFPAGSTVHAGGDGKPLWGSVPLGTVIAGLPLQGRFAFAAGRLWQGTLARPADIDGVPCGPGPFLFQADTTQCVLAHDFEWLGHTLAAQTAVQLYHSPETGQRALHLGTLAGPELLFDVRWPAGTVIGNVWETPAQMAQGTDAAHGTTEVCLAPGSTAELASTTLHGPVTFGASGEGREVNMGCRLQQVPMPGEGYAEAAGRQFIYGKRPNAHARWRWS